MANEQYLIRGVKALYPRINQPYHWDDQQRRSVPCGPLDDGAKYEMSFVMDETVAEDLYNRMDAAYTQRRKAKWPKELGAPTEVFTETDDGGYEYKTSIKAAFNGNIVGVPEQFDSKMNILPEDFELTHGSTVNIVVELIPYHLNGHGVSLRLRQVQVTELAEKKARASDLFQSEEGGFTLDETSKPTFGVKNVADQMPDIEEEEEEVEEPKKVVSMKKEKAAPASKEDLGGLVNKWGAKRKID